MGVSPEDVTDGRKAKYSEGPAVMEAAEAAGFKKNVEDVVRLAKLVEGCVE